MSASRLPGKPLLKINNLSIISHVVKKAKSTEIGQVVVCTEDQSILEDVIKNGGEAIITSSHHKSGTDRIFEAYQKLKIKDVDYILNLQGDEPLIDEKDIIHLNNMMIETNSNIGTLGAKIEDKKMFLNNNIVKVETEQKLNNENSSLAMSFRRKHIFKKDENIYHHIGIYAYKVQALQKFVNFKQSKNEIKNKLEQLRALDNDLEINVALANSSSISVDVQEDYLAIKKIMEYKL